ncbi:hypothetical protein KUTeg_024052 [Tegillarca granosa]|uniref:Beta-lactamase-related domain-containing protein n=1 Tax=Tegillarca granosa TaxID=220873 RepID=A0ABQ9E1D7_TEGGR|nr:hypothetical protein KUTeg_024052 [Tegillarca granosa]
MIMMYLFCMLILMFNVGVQVVSCKDQLGDYADLKFTRFESFIENVIRCRGVTGATITMVKNNKVVFKRGFGYENVEKRIPVTWKTKFCIGSLTKAFTSTLIAKLLDLQDSITWDTPIRDILGHSFRLYDNLRTENVNLRDLLSHKVGTPPYFRALLVGFSENMTREDFVRMLQHQPTAKPFRTDFLYSNYMYTLAGYVAEKLGKDTWENLVTEMIFKPLGMSRSGFVDKVQNFKNFAFPYSFLNGTAVPLDITLTQSVHPSGPAGSIYSTGSDMAKWIQYHLTELNKLSTKNNDNPSNLMETYKGQMPSPFPDNDWYRPIYPVEDVAISYNMGWITSIYRGFQRFWHSGGIVTYSSFLSLYPNKHSGVFISLTGSKNNENSLPMKALISMASDVLLDVPSWLNETSACLTPAPWKIKVEKRSEVNKNTMFLMNNISDIKDYEGFYEHPAFGQINVKAADNKSDLFLHFGRFGRMRLIPLKDKGEFLAEFIDKLWFVTGSDGKSSYYPVTFVYSEDNNIVGLKFPVDRKYDRSFFTKYCQDKSTISLIISIITCCFVLHILLIHNKVNK